MNLEEFLFENSLTIKDFSEMIGYHPSYVIKIKNNTTPITKRVAYVVSKATKGKVNLEYPGKNTKK